MDLGEHVFAAARRGFRSLRDAQRRFGSRWSSEVVEHKTERGSVTVLCKLTVDGTSKMQFGSARANGDEGAALRPATETALRSCAEMFGDDGRGRGARASAGGCVPPARARAVPSRVRRRASAPGESRRLDTVALDLIENALRNARYEMDAVLFRSAMSPVIREQHDEFPMITDPKGRMIVGQFGSYVNEMLAEQQVRAGAWRRHPAERPVQMRRRHQPHQRLDGAGAGVSRGRAGRLHLDVRPLMDVGGWVPGSMPTDATSIFGEGIRIPPLLLYKRGELNKAVSTSS